MIKQTSTDLSYTIHLKTETLYRLIFFLRRRTRREKEAPISHVDGDLRLFSLLLGGDD